jgi:hypothetical protein
VSSLVSQGEGDERRDPGEREDAGAARGVLASDLVLHSAVFGAAAKAHRRRGHEPRGPPQARLHHKFGLQAHAGQYTRTPLSHLSYL